MNRILQYLKNIKFNHFINKVVANEGKKIYSTKKPNKRFQQTIVRKFTTHNSYQKPPNDNGLIFISILLGSYFIAKNNK